ncbi:MAG TPA: DUF3570 domain-containing protein [Polyangia bacterium]
MGHALSGRGAFPLVGRISAGVVALAAAACAALVAAPAFADNHVTLRGQYYREPSTRVVQPVVEIEKDLPAGFDVNTHVLLDAITSASAASGPSGDTIFTEVRDEAGVRVGKNWERFRLTLGYTYSAESDYWSHIVVGGGVLRLWGDSATLSFSVGGGHDTISKRVQGASPRPPPEFSMRQGFAGLWYGQVLSPTLVVQGGYETALLDGYLGSPYRPVGPQGVEVVPSKRWRHALGLRGAQYLPASGTGFQLHYRYYFDVYPGPSSDYDGKDPWRVSSHTVELRVFQRLTANLELRLTGRYYSQGAAAFWCDLAQNASCLSSPSRSAFASVYTSDPKLSPVSTKYLEGKLYWDAVGWRGLDFFGWFSAGTFELSYGYYWQSTSYEGANVLQVGYTIPY